MDSVTHIALGACIGEAIAGRRLGRKALFLGAFAQSIPDLDFVASFFLPPTADLLAHRGFSHSLLFVALAAPLLALLSRRLFARAQLSAGQWSVFWGVQVFIHIFIDAFNAYGTAWFEPFSHYRVSFNTLFVADPLFTIWPLIAFIALLILRPGSLRRKAWAAAGITLSASYLLLCIAFKLSTERHISSTLAAKHINTTRHFSTPTPVNSLLWYVVAQGDSGFYTGYRSVLDRKENIDLRYIPQNKGLLASVKDTADLARLKRFSRGYYYASQWQDTLVFNDLCFGEITGWQDTAAGCVFYYDLTHPDNNTLVVQRGRFARWNKHTLKAFWERIKGI